MNSELLIKLAGELSKLKYSDKDMNSLNLKHSTSIEGDYISLHSYGTYHGIPIEIIIKFRKVTVNSVKKAFMVTYNILKLIKPSREFRALISKYKNKLNHKITVIVIVEKHNEVNYNILLSSGAKAYCKHNLNSMVVEYGFEGVHSLKEALFLVTLLQSPMNFINQKDKMVIKQLLLGVIHYSLMNKVSERVIVSINTKYGDVTVKLYSLTNHISKVSSFNIIMLQGKPFEESVKLIHSVLNK